MRIWCGRNYYELIRGRIGIRGGLWRSVPRASPVQHSILAKEKRRASGVGSVAGAEGEYWGGCVAGFETVETPAWSIVVIARQVFCGRDIGELY